MIKHIELCDYCGVEFSGKTGKNGFCAEVGYSKHGWGRRRNFFHKVSWEVCDKCYGPLAEASEALATVIDSRKRIKP